jgi:hypothetical protein
MTKTFANWKHRIPEDLAKKVKKDGKSIGQGTFVKDCYWKGYEFEGRYFIGLCWYDDMWETDKETMELHCLED